LYCFCLYLLERFPSQTLRHVFMLTFYILLKNYVTYSCWLLHPFSRITSRVHVDVLHPFSRIMSSVHVGWKALWSSFSVTLSFQLQPSNVKSPRDVAKPQAGFRVREICTHGSFNNLQSTFLLSLWGALVTVIAWLLDIQLPMQSVLINTGAVSLNLDQGELYNTMWYIWIFRCEFYLCWLFAVANYHAIDCLQLHGGPCTFGFEFYWDVKHIFCHHLTTS
jgi:hypothetical protein